MENNKCSNVDPMLLRSFPELETADLSYNNIPKIPQELFYSLRKLKEINFRHNKITSVRGIFQKVPNLRYVNLSQNKISSISGIFRNLKRLKTLDLKYNKIQRLNNGDFEGMRQLKRLDLSGNNLQLIEMKSFSDLKNLWNLNLCNNSHLHRLNSSLHNLLSLKRLDVCFTSLQNIHHEDFYRLTKLSTLNLQGNKITTVTDAFRDLSSLYILSIDKNSIKTLTQGTLPERNTIKKLWLAGNKWHCDCRLRWMIEWLSQKNTSVIRDNPSCHLPRRLHKKQLIELTIQDVTEWPEDCPELCHCECVPRNLHIYIKVDCSDKNFTQIPRILTQHLGFLDLSGNALQSVSNISFVFTETLHGLNLERNRISVLDTHFPTFLKVLRLSGNLLKVLPLSSLPNGTFESITLSSNPWICDCKARNFRKWLLSHINQVKDVNDTRCGSTGPNPTLYGRVIVSLHDNDLCPSIIALYASITIGILGFLSLSALVVIGLIRYHFYIKVWLYSKGFTFVKKDDMDSNMLFDGYLSYNTEDEQSALTQLAPGLEEKEPRFTLCIPERDIALGEPCVNAALSPIQYSKRIIIMLSKCYMDDGLCMSVFRSAFAQSLEDKLQRVILIKMNDTPLTEDVDPDLKIALGWTNCLKWGERLFWEKLRYAMPKRKQNQKTSGDNIRLKDIISQNICGAQGQTGVNTSDSSDTERLIE